ncbi:unnamed protein product [Calypogeia fissa]
MGDGGEGKQVHFSSGNDEVWKRKWGGNGGGGEEGAAEDEKERSGLRAIEIQWGRSENALCSAAEGGSIEKRRKLLGCVRKAIMENAFSGKMGLLLSFLNREGWGDGVIKQGKQQGRTAEVVGE